MKSLLCLLVPLLFLANAAADVRIYPAPEGETLSAQYKIFVGNQEVSVYSARVLDPPFAGKEYDFGGPYSFANLDTSGPLELRITANRALTNVVIRPINPEIKMRNLDEHTISVSLPGPCKISVEPDGRKGPLLLFANPMESSVPQPGDPNVIFFGPGVHRAGKLEVGSGQTLYLAGGAVVKGGVLAQGNNIRITGRGILDGNDYEWRKGPTPHVISIRGTNVEVSGITVRGASHWTIVPVDSRHVTVRDVKLCGSRVQNDDGINPCNSADVLITDCFIRTDDDCVALKGLNLAGSNNVERIIVQNSVLWCDRARIFLLGHESRAEFMRDINLRNLDIIHFTMTPFLFEPGEEMRLQNVKVENVRMYGEGQAEFVRLKPVVNQYMHNKVPGHINDILFRNVSIAGKPGAYRVEVEGSNAQHTVENVLFSNVIVHGETLTANSPQVRIGQHTSGIAFTNSIAVKR